MIQQQILAIPPHAQLEADRLNEMIVAATGHACADSVIALIAQRDALLAEREPRPIGIGERF